MKNQCLLRAVSAATIGLTFLLLSPASAQTFDIFTEDLSAFNSTLSTGDGTTYGISLIESGGPFGTGNHARFFDLNTAAKPEAQGEVPQAITGPFQVAFQSLNQSASTNSGPAIRWRMANTGKSISSSNRSALSLSWHADLRFSASYLTTSNTVSSVATAPQDGTVHDVMMVGNASTNETYAYDFAGLSRTLNPLSYDVFIDGALLNSEAEFTGGLGFSAGVATEFDPALGLKRFGLIGSSNADEGPDVLYDNITLNIGEIAVELPIAQAQRTVTDGFLFASAADTVYLLQSSTNASEAIPTWQNTGLEVLGDGSDLVLFDPAGYNSNKAYRVIEAR